MTDPSYRETPEAPATTCHRCGHDPACGFASLTIGNQTLWLCHDGGHSCYEATQVKVERNRLVSYTQAEGLALKEPAQPPTVPWLSPLEAKSNAAAVRPLPDWMPTPERMREVEQRLPYMRGSDAEVLVRAVRWFLEERENR